MIDLKELIGKKYKVRMDESYLEEKSDGKTKDIAWYYEVHGFRGYLYPYSKSSFAIEMTNQIAKKHRNHTGVSVLRTCDEGTTLIIPDKMLSEGLHWIRARRRRRLTEDQKRKSFERLAKFRWKPRT